LTGFAIDANTLDLQRYTKPGTKTGTKIGPVIGIGRKPVMDMHGAKSRPQFQAGQQVKQDYRIAASGEPNGQRFFWRSPGGNKVANPAQQLI